MKNQEILNKNNLQEEKIMLAPSVPVLSQKNKDKHREDYGSADKIRYNEVLPYDHPPLAYNSPEETKKGSKKIATPIGWVYYKEGYNSDDKVSLTLSQALREIKDRGRGIPVDGIYSILGLLPYGRNVKPNYKPKECLVCSPQVTEDDCQHEEAEKN
ncbi:12430_t:CDS:2 [Ambispora gerdemannii]|uniref:12430_t:CDS:1 n=1 Tax=Ambispora gerdemannii TaxID=144530 RepID=A0A9N9A9H9_9GLOM|nr:12430_t:CDS:2 [Ambispora gerdemannii]